MFVMLGGACGLPCSILLRVHFKPTRRQIVSDLISEQRCTDGNARLGCRKRLALHALFYKERRDDV
jgi:hypothetical protein